ncbi:MAG: hypothetical protein HKN49_04295, partial [Gammaproteobacteria bacterium]|nr:hypothetical protein [Gammaproteobacteria bacterium]
MAAFACHVSEPAAIALMWSPVTLAADSGLPELMPDGWHSWQVAATRDAPVGCCYQRYGDFVSPVVCQLGKSMSFVGNADEMGADEVAIYARFEKGQIQSVRALAPDCPVEASARINPHGVVRNDDSVIHLAHAIAPRSDVSAEVIAAISFHAGAEARRTLEATAIGGAELANRKDAIFWIGQSRAAEMRTLLRRLMFNDANPEIRQHTAFAWSQSKLPDVA